MAISIHHLDISADLFCLATRAVERHSVELGRFASINDVIQHATECALVAKILPISIEQALEIETDGPIRISLVVREGWRENFREVREQLSESAGRRLSVKQAVAVLLRYF